ncbi:MAG: aldo/keto reductase [Gammaproteobacteria bacterium]
MNLGLGSVQFGTAYGVTNAGGVVPGDEVGTILALAAQRGVRVIDTAHLYGNAEAVLGRELPRPHSFRIVTKTPKFAGAGDAGAVSGALAAALEASLGALGEDRVAGLIVHDCGDLLGRHGDALWAALEAHRAAGAVERIGASVYNGAEIDALLERYPLELVQLPLNVLDRRLVVGGQLARLVAAGVEVHVRSVFLQGLVLTQPDRLDARFSALRGPLAALRAALTAAGLGVVEGALRAVGGLPGIGTIVVGVTSAAEFREILDAAERAESSLPRIDFESFGCDDERLLNPARWAELEPIATSTESPT